MQGALERVKSEVAAWPDVEQQPHRFGGLEFVLGKRELGHIHGDRLVDIPFPRAVRDEVVKSGQAAPHHILPDTGWVSIWLRDEEDVARAIELLRRSYQLALAQRERMRAIG
jgi:hypothetical protein